MTHRPEPATTPRGWGVFFMFSLPIALLMVWVLSSLFHVAQPWWNWVLGIAALIALEAWRQARVRRREQATRRWTLLDDPEDCPPDDRPRPGQTVIGICATPPRPRWRPWAPQPDRILIDQVTVDFALTEPLAVHGCAEGDHFMVAHGEELLMEITHVSSFVPARARLGLILWHEPEGSL